MDLLRARLAAQHGVIVTRDAAACGLTRRDLTSLVRQGVLRRVRPGAYVDAVQWKDARLEVRHALRAMAVSRSFDGRHAVSHDSAAALWDLPLIGSRLGETVHLCRQQPGKTRSRAGVAMHVDLPRSLIRSRHGVACVHPAVAVVQTAATAGFEQGVVCADAALARGIASTRDLAAALRLARLGEGAAVARAVVAFADSRSESPGESRARVLCHALGLPSPELQVEVRDDRGGLVGRVDFLFRAERVVVEFDGLVKYGEASARENLIAEKRREDALRALGYEVVRLTWKDLADPERVRQMVLDAFARSSGRGAAAPV